MEFLTDLGNAQRFVAQYGTDIRYCPSWGKWLVWDDKRWRKDEIGEVEQMAKQSARSFLHKAAHIEDSGERKLLTAHALSSEYATRIAATLRLARTEDGIPVLPGQLDSNGFLLNCFNGTLDLKTGKLGKHFKKNLLTKLSPVPFDSDANCPNFLRFLQRIMDGDQALIDYLQGCLGYGMTGDVGEKALFVLYGNGNNGKTTLVEAVRYVLGDYAGQIPIDSLLAPRWPPENRPYVATSKPANE
jgi:putative DNA primase/helicase